MAASHLPPLPEPVVIDGRRLYTAGDMREYARLCLSLQDSRESVSQAKSQADSTDDFGKVFGSLFK